MRGLQRLVDGWAIGGVLIGLAVVLVIGLGL